MTKINKYKQQEIIARFAFETSGDWNLFRGIGFPENTKKQLKIRIRTALKKALDYDY